MSRPEHNQNQESQMYSRESESKPGPKLHKLTRPEIIGVLNAIIDLYLDIPMTPSKANVIDDKLKPFTVPVTRVPRVPKKINLPENKRRGDAMLDVLDTLRTYVKYGLFDRDALRREVAYLKKLVEENGGDA